MKHLLIALLVIGSLLTTCHFTTPVVKAAHAHDMSADMTDNMQMEKDSGENDCCDLTPVGSKFIKNLPLKNDLEDDLVVFLNTALINYLQVPSIDSNNHARLLVNKDYFESQFFKNIRSVKQNK